MAGEGKSGNNILLRRGGAAATYFVLIALLLFVQLPLIWMILTALKQPGQAFKLRFLPQTRVLSEPLTASPIPGENPVVIFEFINKSAQKVNVAGDFNGWNKDTHPLEGAEGVWTLRLDDVKPGAYEYKFVLNGSQWITDPENQKERNGNSLIEVTDKGLSSNKLLSNQTFFNKDRLSLKIMQEPDALDMAVMTEEGQLVALSAKDGYWAGEAKTSSARYRIERRRSWGAALGAIYTLKNFENIITNPDFPFLRYFLNSLVVATGAGILTVLICAMAGYAFAKKQFWGRDQIFGILFSAMLIPGMIFMVPQFAIVLRLGWINTIQGMIVPHLANVFGLFLLRQYIRTIPDSLFQAAEIDGAGEAQVFLRIVVPLSLPIMVTLFLLTFVGQWSNFLWQLITNTPDSRFITLPVGLQLFKGQYAQDWEPIMAGACFSIIPIALLFLMAQRYFIEGMAVGAVKE